MQTNKPITMYKPGMRFQITLPDSSFITGTIGAEYNVNANGTLVRAAYDISIFTSDGNALVNEFWLGVVPECLPAYEDSLYYKVAMQRFRTKNLK